MTDCFYISYTNYLDFPIFTNIKTDFSYRLDSILSDTKMEGFTKTMIVYLYDTKLSYYNSGLIPSNNVNIMECWILNLSFYAKLLSNATHNFLRLSDYEKINE